MAIIGIVAIDQHRAMGKDNNLLCILKDDLKHFHDTTKGSIVVMGRKTWNSIGRPLPDRTNIILTRNENHPVPKCMECHLMHSQREVMDYYCRSNKDMYVIGGSEIYKLFEPFISKFIITHIDHKFEDADTFFPNFQFGGSWTDLLEKTVPANEDNEYGFDIVSYYRQ